MAFNRGDPVLVYSDRGLSRSAAVTVAFISFQLRISAKVSDRVAMQQKWFGSVFGSNLGSIEICRQTSIDPSSTIVHRLYRSVEWETASPERGDVKHGSNVDHRWWSNKSLNDRTRLHFVNTSPFWNSLSAREKENLIHWWIEFAFRSFDENIETKGWETISFSHRFIEDWSWDDYGHGSMEIRDIAIARSLVYPSVFHFDGTKSLDRADRREHHHPFDWHRRSDQVSSAVVFRWASAERNNPRCPYSRHEHKPWQEMQNVGRDNEWNPRRCRRNIDFLFSIAQHWSPMLWN